MLDFVAAMEKCSIREAALQLQQWFGVAASVGAPRPRLYQAAADMQNWELVRKEEGSNAPLGFTLTGVDRNHPYLAQLGIDPATAVEFGMGL